MTALSSIVLYCALVLCCVPALCCLVYWYSCISALQHCVLVLSLCLAISYDTIACCMPVPGHCSTCNSILYTTMLAKCCQRSAANEVLPTECCRQSAADRVSSTTQLPTQCSDVVQVPINWPDVWWLQYNSLFQYRQYKPILGYLCKAILSLRILYQTTSRTSIGQYLRLCRQVQRILWKECSRKWWTRLEDNRGMSWTVFVCVLAQILEAELF